MNIKDMHIAFKIDLDKALSSNMPNFDVYQIDYLLYTAYIMLINQKFTGNNYLTAGFEENNKRISDIQALIVDEVIAGNITNKYAKNEVSFDISNIDMMYPITSVFKFNDELFAQTVNTNHKDVNSLRMDVNNRPWIPIPISIYENNKIIVYIDPDDISKIETNYPELILTYIRNPKKFNFFSTNGEEFEPIVPEHMHFEIVSLAVDLAIENIESQRVQTHPKITGNKE